MRYKEYPFEDVKVSFKGYKRLNRKIVVGKGIGILYLPPRFAGKTFNIYLEEVKTDEKQSDQKSTEKTSQETTQTQG